MKKTTLKRVLKSYGIFLAAVLCTAVMFSGFILTSQQSGTMVFGKEFKNVGFSFDKSIKEKLKPEIEELKIFQQAGERLVPLSDYLSLFYLSPVKNLLWLLESTEDFIYSLK